MVQLNHFCTTQIFRIVYVFATEATSSLNNFVILRIQFRVLVFFFSSPSSHIFDTHGF